MIFLHKLGLTSRATRVVGNSQIPSSATETPQKTKQETLPTDPTNTIQAPPNPPTDNYDRYYTDEKDKKPKKLLRRITSSVVDITSRVLGAGVVIYSLFQTPGTYKALNKIDQLFGRTSNASITTPISENPINNINGIPVDSFVSGYRDFTTIHKAILNTKINPQDLDSNKNNIILDAKGEINKLITIFKSINENRFKDEIKLLEEIKITSQLIWGRNGPNIYITQQNERPNCQVMGVIQGSFTTNQNIQSVKGKVHVLNFNPSPENFRIDTMVKLNNKNIYVPFEALIDWMSIKTGSQSSSKDGSLSVPILTYVIEKELNNYGGVPNPFPSSPNTLLLGKNYCLVPISTLSDNELINILSQAPNTPTNLITPRLITKRPETVNIFKDAFSYWSESSNLTNSRANLFMHTLLSNLENIKSDTSNPINYANYPNSKSPLKEIAADHRYTVKDFKKVNNEHITTIIDSNGFEHDLTLDEIRNYTSNIVTEPKNIPLIGAKGTEAILWTLITLMLLCKTTSCLNKLILPKEDKKSEIFNS